jgi:hypothetical protein
METGSTQSHDNAHAIADDIIHGAEAIAEHIYGHRTAGNSITSPNAQRFRSSGLVRPCA